MRFFVIPLLLAAAASAEVFHFASQQGQSSVYGVRGAVTVGVQKLTGEKTALEYNGTLVLEQIRAGEFLAKFTHFTLGKYGKIDRNINDETLGDLKPGEQRLMETLREHGSYGREMQRPVKFYMKEGKVVRTEAEKEHKQWSLNIFRSVFTLLQNQARKPTTLAVPHIEYQYEDGITGNCKVQYEILSQPDAFYAQTDNVYNMTKTVDYKDCLERPVYRHLKDVPRGCTGVSGEHKPENFLANYEEEKTDYELKPTPGSPVNQQRKDSLVTVSSVAEYNVTDGRLEEARTQSTDIYRLFGGEIEVSTKLQLRLRDTEGPKIEEPQNVQAYTSLQQRLPVQEESELDIPIYALMKEHNTHQYPKYFQSHFDAVIGELRQVQQGQRRGQKPGHEQQGFNTPAYMIELIQTVSGMTEKELRQTIPQVVHQHQPVQLDEEEQLRRQLWIELIGKAGSKSAVNIVTEFIKNKTFTPSEVRRVLQDLAGFQSYPDTDMIEQVLALCTKQGGLTATGKATACVAAGKIISKACDSKVFQWSQKEWKQRKHQSLRATEQRTQQESESEEYETTMDHQVIEPQLRCTPEKLQQYVERLSLALRQSTDFKQVVAYINGLSKMQKPEVLSHLIGYVNGTASNMHQLREQGEQQDESVDFVRRVAIVSLRDIGTKYPKEINPIVRVIYQNTTEKVQTRLVAFDIWMNTQPAQWEVEKVMQVANKDTSVELSHYVYTALQTAMKAEEPCYQLFAQRIRAAWAQILPFDSGMRYSQFRSKSMYSPREDFGMRAIWKVITSNTTFLPAYTHAKVEQIRGPYIKTLFGAKLLVKGGDKVWDELTGKDGLLERIAYAIDGQVKTGERQRQTEQLLKNIAEGMDIKNFNKETPKAVLFWRLASGEAVIPIDAEYVEELKQELLQTVTKIGKQGVTGHYLRVLVPTKAFQVEPTSMGFPIVHSTIHPIVISVRYENLKLHFKNQEGRVLPQSFELTGSIKPTVLSLRQTRVFVAEEAGQTSPTLKFSDIKELNLGFLFKIGFEYNQRRFQMNIKPHFERVFHSGFCTELKLEKNTIIDEEPGSKTIDYGKCVKSLYEPIRHDKQLGNRQSGMLLQLTGESHQPWSGLPIFGSKDALRYGFFGALLNRLANKSMRHHAISLYLRTDKHQPMNEWSAVIDMDSNIEALAKIPVEQQTKESRHIKAQYQPRRQEQLDSELQQVLSKVESLLKKTYEEISGTTIEKQLLVKLEGRYQGQPRNTIKIAMKRIFNLEETEQQFALAAETQQSREGIEIFTNVSYPKIGSLFDFDPTFIGEDERMNGTLIAKFHGGQREQVYRVDFQAVRSEEQRKESELEWFEVRCLAEQKAGTAVSDACRKAILKKNSLDRMEMTIQLPNNVHPLMKQLAKKALSAVKYGFYPHMQSDISGRQHQKQQRRDQQQQIFISANATRDYQWALLYNVRIEMPREKVTFSNIRLPGLRPVHKQLTLKQQLENVAVRGNFHGMCFLGNFGVRTYDNVTFPLDVKTGCEYVIAHHQGPTPGATDFTATIKLVDPKTNLKQVRARVSGTDVVLEPFGLDARFFTISVNGTKHQLTNGKPVITHYGPNKQLFIHVYDMGDHDVPATIHLYIGSENFHVFFNGHAVLLALAHKYEGNVNGLCGNDDNESAHEFIGPNGHEYQHSNEFIASYGVGSQCQVLVENPKEKMMEKLNQELEQIRRQEQRKGEMRRKLFYEDSQWDSQPKEWQEETEEFYHNQQGMEFGIPTMMMATMVEGDSDGQVLRTYVSIQKNRFCFSIEQVPSCKIGYHKEGVLRTEQVESVCLERSNRVAHEAMQEIRRHHDFDISKLEQEPNVHLTVTVNIPKCVRR